MSAEIGLASMSCFLQSLFDSIYSSHSTWIHELASRRYTHRCDGSCHLKSGETPDVIPPLLARLLFRHMLRRRGRRSEIPHCQVGFE